MDKSMDFYTSRTVGELAVEFPSSMRIFEKLGIDYCCGGKKSLDQVCADISLDLNMVVSAIKDSIIFEETSIQIDWNKSSLFKLVEYILDKHHKFTKTELPRLSKLMDKVHAVHNQNHPELQSLKELFSEFTEELTSHMTKEEEILFPYIIKLEKTPVSDSLPSSCFGSIQNPIRMMEYEHDQSGIILKKMRNTTNNYWIPSDGCFSYKALYSGFENLELDLHKHIHLESNVLFPRAIKLEKLFNPTCIAAQ